MKRTAAVLSLLAALTLSPGCATVAAWLPTVIAYVQDGAIVVDTIERFADKYFDSHPGTDLEKKADLAIARTRAALDAVLHVATGADNINKAQVDAAFDEFRKAYGELVALLAPIGVSSGGALRAAPGHLTVPAPLAMERRL